jgi:hypothetical protein
MDLSGNNYLFVFWVCWPGLAPAGDLLSCPRKKGGKEGVLRSVNTCRGTRFAPCGRCAQTATANMNG